jgi:hypothetical protein
VSTLGGQVAGVYNPLQLLNRFPSAEQHMNLAAEVLDGDVVAQENASQQSANMFGSPVRRIALGGAAEKTQREVGTDLAHANGGDAFLGGVATEKDPMVVSDLGVYSDPLELVSSQAWRAFHRPIVRAVQWNVLAPLMDKVVRELREEGSAPRLTGPRIS